MPRILLTTPVYPYPVLPNHETLVDAMGQRFSHPDEIFTLTSHTHCYANHLLAQNINVPSTLLEYPRWPDFKQEVDKGYDVIGISALPVHLNAVIEMCKYIRAKSPQTKILMGSYGAMAFAAKYDSDVQKKYFDQLVLGDGIRFMRQMLGEEISRPVIEKLMPKAGGAPKFLCKYPSGNIGFLVTGLGCPGKCDFCSETALYGYARTEVLSPKSFVEHMHSYHKRFHQIRQIFVIEEDHFRFPEYLVEVRTEWERHPDMCESLDWVTFGSVDNIGRFAAKYGWDTIGELGIGAIFIGIESKYAGAHGYEKRKECDAREVFQRLHQMGIRTLGAWVCGWDFHDHANIHEDLNYFVACYPTYQQLSQLSPFPGTELYDKMKKEDRLRDISWDEMHFWSTALKNKAFERHEPLNIVEHGYDIMYKTWGPSILRCIDVLLNGYEYWEKSDKHLMRNSRTVYFKTQASLKWLMLKSLFRFAPNGIVRNRVRKIDERYRQVIGEPTLLMKLVSFLVLQLAVVFKVKNYFDPFNQYLKEEPYKRYIYEKKATSDNDIPYRTEYPGKTPLTTRVSRIWEKLKFGALARLLKLIRIATWYKSDSIIDKYIITAIQSRNFGGF